MDNGKKTSTHPCRSRKVKRFPVDMPENDQSFMSEGTHDLNDQTIIKTIILMAQLLKLQVIAEGVETNDQVRLFIYQCMHYRQRTSLFWWKETILSKQQEQLPFP
ncbi:EAL domain-containing protein [Peribacillus sp. NPDC058075]|uniref:EAL domain-containing protein n=1 Tax=unclassified Peribacillus TaxID=2675266 RepID=UPI0036D98E55